MLDPVTLCDIHSEKISGLFLQPWGLHSISILKKQFKLVLTKFYITLVLVGAKLQLGPSCRLPTASPGRWIGGRPPDMVASCDLSG